MTRERELEIIELIQKEVKPALGCTEPIAVSLAVARSCEALREIGAEPGSILVEVSANILKNGMGVGIPGTGMIGLHIASALAATCGKSRYGLEVLKDLNPQAIEDAKANAERNGIKNAEFFCGDAGKVAEKLKEEGLRPNVITVDPPRKGLAPEVPALLAGMEPERIVYVSCDPATLARDLKRLGELGYTAVRAEAVDLFPRTAHIETVCILQRKVDAK